MKRLSPARAAVACAGLLLVVASFGCVQAPAGLFIANKRPTVELTAAPIGMTDTTWYSYRINWSGSDEDGRVEAFQYAIDPPSAPDADTVWISTVKNEQQLFFRATNAFFDPRRGWRSNDLHTFVIRAVDNAGAVSAPKSRSFYSYTIAPIVFISSPPPTKFFSRLVAPSVRINWVGRDEDGVFSQKPVQYKYRLFREGDSDFDFQTAVGYPDAVRKYYAARNFAGWDSVRGDTTFVQYTQLTPNAQHLFAVVGIDEAGAYSPEFSLESNMLRFTPGYAGTLGPMFTVFNEFFFYHYASGGSSTDPLAWINLEVPAGRPIAYNWFAEPPEGATIEWYRWKLDGDVGDATPRTNEDTDWYHWSRMNNLTTSCVVGPFAGGEEHFLYLEAHDNTGLTSLAIVHFRTITPTFESELLIVDDTRLTPDRLLASGVPMTYGNTAWPAAAELDTFLYARGGFPWRGPHGIAGDLPRSRPGVFEGYSYDTLGTRLAFELANSGVPLSRLGRYRHILWLTDVTGATTPYTDPLSIINPTSTLRWMSVPGRLNTLATYLYSGGRVWLAGGTGALCTLGPYNASGAQNNDNLYGSGYTIFSTSAGELAPGRLMWDSARWRSEMASSLSNSRPVRSSAAVGGWSNPGWRFSGTITAPDYSRLPAQMRRRALALGDSLPPTRTIASTFYTTSLWPATEYLTRDNTVVEDFDPSPLVEDVRAALDTLYELQGGPLATSYTLRRPVTMTYYHGVEAPPFVFTGFDLWTWSRQDVVGLVDFVLQEVWGMRRAASRR